jgi:hypothetical protein
LSDGQRFRSIFGKATEGVQGSALDFRVPP